MVRSRLSGSPTPDILLGNNWFKYGRRMKKMEEPLEGHQSAEGKLEAVSSGGYMLMLHPTQ